MAHFRASCHPQPDIRRCAIRQQKRLVQALQARSRPDPWHGIERCHRLPQCLPPVHLVQPVIAKLILPRFGGSVRGLGHLPGVLPGGIAARLCLRASPGTQRGQPAFEGLHLTLLLGSLALLPIVPVVAWPGGCRRSARRCRSWGLLILSIGLPFTLLAMTGPLLQAWQTGISRNPYRLFAVSNLASLAALLAIRGRSSPG